MKNKFIFYAKITIAILAVLVLAGLTWRLHFIVSLSIIGIATIPIRSIILEFKHILELEKWSQRIENVYVISNNKFDGRQLEIADPDLYKCCVFVSHHLTLSTAREIEDYLAESKNKRYCDTKIHAHQRLQVHTLIFRHGQDCNEEWKTFAVRVTNFIKADRRKRHNSLSSTNDKEWYHRHVNLQVI